VYRIKQVVPFVGRHNTFTAFISVHLLCSFNRTVSHIALSLVLDEVPKLYLSLDSCASQLDHNVVTSNRFLDMVHPVLAQA